MKETDTGDRTGAAGPSHGFRRTGPPPDRAQSSGLRARLTLAASGQGRAVRDGLAIFRGWDGAAAVAAAVFPAASLRGAVAARRALRRSLRVLGTRPTSIADLLEAPRGMPVRVTGRIGRRRWKRFSHIWTKSEMTAHSVRLLVEEGHDFLLVESGHVALVIVAGGYLIGGAPETLDAGDLVEVFGFVDRVVDGGTSRLRGEPQALALRAGDELPLIVRKISKTDDLT